MLRTIRLPSFRICFIFLSLLFFYDIFFVFITPLITPSGESIMVEVATGGGRPELPGAQEEPEESSQGEQLPMVLRVPHLNLLKGNPYPCQKFYSLLGYGDILVPGLLVSYAHAFDLIFKTPRRLYFCTSVLSYGLGLLLTFGALYLMSGLPQPALLYLVPATVLPLFFLAFCRSQLGIFWRGPDWRGEVFEQGPGEVEVNRPPAAEDTGLIETGPQVQNSLVNS